MSNGSQESKIEWREATLAGVSVTISEPTAGSVAGITFLLTGAMIPQREYASTRQVLVEDQKQVVIGIYINVLTRAHDWYALKIPQVYQAYLDDKKGVSSLEAILMKNRFNIVGHSAGGKICLLVAATKYHDQEPKVQTVLALDPVDLNPSVFTGPEPLGLNDSSATTIVLTWANATSSWSIPPAHNSHAIYEVISSSIEQSRALQPLVIHEGAGHMAYTDMGGGWIAKCIMRGGNKAANRAALENTHALIRKHIK